MLSLLLQPVIHYLSSCHLHFHYSYHPAISGFAFAFSASPMEALSLYADT